MLSNKVTEVSQSPLQEDGTPSKATVPAVHVSSVGGAPLDQAVDLIVWLWFHFFLLVFWMETDLNEVWHKETVMFLEYSLFSVCFAAAACQSNDNGQASAPVGLNGHKGSFVILSILKNTTAQKSFRESYYVSGWNAVKTMHTNVIHVLIFVNSHLTHMHTLHIQTHTQIKA